MQTYTVKSVQTKVQTRQISVKSGQSIQISDNFCCFRPKCIIPPPQQFGLYPTQAHHQPSSLQGAPNVDSMLRLDEAGSIQGIGVPCEGGFFVDHL